jgi:putative ABC transport system permease protein
MPDWKAEVRKRLSGLQLAPARENAIVEEVAQHLDESYAELLASGVSEADAYRHVRAELRDGGLLTHGLRRVERSTNPEPIVLGTNRKTNMIANLWQDLRFGARMLLKQPGFTLIAALTLALGIGANTAIFSIVNAVLISPLPYRDSDRLMQFWETNPLKNWTQVTVAPANLFDWEKQSQSFTEFAAYWGSDKKGPSLSGVELNTSNGPQRLRGLFVTGNIFSVLGADAFIGRTLREEETVQGKSAVVVLSYNLWQRQFGGDPKIVGQKILLNGVSREVVGVMPPDFYFPSKEADLWFPMGWDREQTAQLRSPHFLRVIGRLKSSVTIEQARAEMKLIAARLEAQYPDTNTQMGVGLGPLKEWIVGDVQLPLVVLLVTVACVLLIACVNVANLLLVRAAARAREIAIRSALGAGQWRIVRQLLTESLVLAVVGSALGLVLALWFKDTLVAFSSGDIPRLEEARLDWRVLGFTLAATLLTTLLTGLMPALQNARPRLAAMLKEGGQKGASGQGRRARHALVVAEIALAVVLVVGAGLMVRSFLRLQNVNPGFDPNNILTLRLTLPEARYKEDSQTRAFFEQAEQRVRSLPGVTAVGSTARLPLKGYRWTSEMTIEGHSPEDYARDVRHEEMTPGYFRAIGLPLVQGRFFNESDQAKSQPVVIVNAALVRRYFPGEDPIGKRIKFSEPTEQAAWQTIIGVVGDGKQDSLRAEVKPEIYQSHLQRAQDNMTLVVRAVTDPQTLISAVREQIRALDPNLPIYDIKTMQAVMDESVARERFIALLLIVFAALALALAAIGIYGVMSYSVAQRTQEIGIRLALGAQRRDVLLLVLSQGMKMTLGGVTLGLLAALGLTRLLAGLLYSVSTTDPTTFVVITALLTAVALLACFVPAWRATQVDPLIALGCE